MTAATRGDLVLLTQEHIDYYSDGRRLVKRTTTEIGMVTSVSRDGVVKAVATAGYGRTPRKLWLSESVVVADKGRVNVEAAMLEAETHCWEGHPGQVKAYSSFEEARAMIIRHICLLD